MCAKVNSSTRSRSCVLIHSPTSDLIMYTTCASQETILCSEGSTIWYKEYTFRGGALQF